MQHYFVNQKINDRFYFNDDDIHHIRSVMRFRNDDEVMVIYENEKYLTKLHIDKQEVYAELVAKQENNSRKIKIHLIQALIKGDKFDFVIQKATELGVDSITPYLAERSIVRIEAKDYEKKMARWAKIAKEAAEQSERTTIPEIETPCTTNELDKHFKGQVIIMDERLGREGGKTLLRYLLENKGEEYTLLIGPEGGFSNKEFEYMEKHGVVSLSLGSQILRSETAAIVALGIISASGEEE